LAASEARTFPCNASPGKQITHFHRLEIHGFAWSPDGKRIALSRGPIEQNVVLIKSGS
jgi:WD40-like Beta Propeller Repeat